jgi:IS5 family transposase
MKYRDQNGGGDMIAIIEHQKKAQEKKIGINKIKDLIDWESFRGELEEILGYANREKSKGGRPPFDPVFMFKILVLQKYYGLSDDAAEEHIQDRASFMSFLDLKMGDFIPDAKTIWDFRQRLEANSMNGSQRLSSHFEKTLTDQGIITREGSIVDATDNAVLADSAYISEESEVHLRDSNCEEFLMRKGKIGTPLSEVEKASNKKISRIRVRVEHIFGTMKHRAMDYVCSIGLNRAHQHNGLCNLVYNLTRYAFLKQSHI